MQNSKRGREKQMISVGIDVSKGKSTVCIMKSGGEVLSAPHEMLHTMEDVLALVERLKSYDEEARIVLESTGSYHWPVVTLLVENGVFVSCINALRMKKYCTQSLRKGKTDNIDSIKIAGYGLAYWYELERYLPPEDIYSELRTYSRQYYQYITLSVKAKINLNNLLDQSMPGIQNLLIDQNGRHKLTDFVRRYWHFGNITTQSKEKFIAAYCKWAKKEGYRMNESKAEEIYALSQNGIPTLPNTESTKALVLEAVRILHELEKSYDIILSHMQQLASTLPEYSVAIAMDGVGPTLAPRFIAEIGNIRRFHSKNAVIAYTGIDAPPYQSGSFTANNRRISKRGNKYLRRTGYEIIQSIMRAKPADDAIYQFILKKQAEGKSSKTAKIAGLNKFLRIYYARVKEVYCEIERLP